MPYIFGKLWHLAIIWAIRKAFQCILQGVRILLANHTRISPTSENDSYLVFKIFTPLRHFVDLLQHLGCLLLHIIWLRLSVYIMHCLLIVKLVLLLESYIKHFHLTQYYLLLLHLKARCRLPSRADQLRWIRPSYICKQGN